VAQAERALRAAQAKLEAGAPEAAIELLALAESAPLEELQRARVDRLRGQIAFASTRGADAPPLLLRAARRLESLDGRLARETYLDALQAAMVAGLFGDLIGEAARAARGALPPPGPPSAEDRLLDTVAVLFTDGHVAAAPLFERALAVTPDRTWTRWPWFLALTAWELWDVDRYSEIAARQVAGAREAGAVTALLPALSMLEIASVHNGDFATAEVLLDEAEALAAATGTTPWAYARVVLAAWRGREREAVEAIRAAAGDATARGEGLLLVYCDLFTAVLRNGLGDYPAALTAAQRAADRIGFGFGFVTRALPELIEAAVHCGAPDAAADALALLHELTHAHATDWGLGVEAYATALVDDEHAEPHFRESLEHLARGPRGAGVYQARAHLLYGEWLRRRRRRGEARERLRSAYELFTAMGAEGFSGRAERELRATGETVRRHTVESRDELTAREAQIAKLARDGFSNAEIAARLFISHRTVEYHLTKVFSKLDIRSRSQLREAMPADAERR
jgi:DNA-binding CsgD family transcriptional regulator